MSLLQRISQNIIYINLDVVEFVEKMSIIDNETETGGILGGTGKVEDGDVIISQASDGGLAAIKRRAFFSRETRYCQSVLDSWAIHSNGNIDYLGEWHKHLERFPHPSPKDNWTMKNIARQSNYHVNIPLLMIIGNTNYRDSLVLFVFNAEGKYELADWKIYDNAAD